MVPPPITPTPHRFLTQTPSHLQSTKHTSSFRTQHHISQSPRQFAPTPKFTSRRFVEDVHSPVAPSSPLPSRLTRSNPRRLQTGEDIDDFSSPPSARSPEEEVNARVHGIRPSVDDIREGGYLDGDGSITVASNPRKRRRESACTSKSETIHISSSPSPTLPLSDTSAHSQDGDNEHDEDISAFPNLLPPGKQKPQSHFRFYPQQSHQDPTPQPTTRPSFLLPAPPIDPPENTPLPEAFSPNRRGMAKYIPGGLASTMREWILEVSTKGEGGTDSTFRGAVGMDVGDLRTGQGIVMALGTGPELHGEEARLLLLGQGRGGGELRRGGRVEIKRPVWDVQVGDGKGEKWMVGVDWRVL